MSNIYVKWNSLKSSGDDIMGYKRNLANYNSEINNIINNLEMSSNISAQIIISLKRNLRNLEIISDKMGKYGSSTQKIAELYKQTEERLTKH